MSESLVSRSFVRMSELVDWCSCVWFVRLCWLLIRVWLRIELVY